MEVGKLTVVRRDKTGKGFARRMRAVGDIPGVCYGAGLDTPLPIRVNKRALKDSLDPLKRNNTVIDMTVEDCRDAPGQLRVMVKDYQYDHIRRELTHVDLLAIDESKPVEVEVPIELVGKAKGLVTGGQLHTVLHAASVRCKPGDIPARLTLDVSELDVGDVLHMSDLSLPEGVELLTMATLTIVTCTAPEAEEEPEDEGEGEAAAEGEGEAAAKPAEAESK